MIFFEKIYLCFVNLFNNINILSYLINQEV